jgi:hypothetical protein
VRVRPTLFDAETPGAVTVDEDAFQKITVNRTCVHQPREQKYSNGTFASECTVVLVLVVHSC